MTDAAPCPNQPPCPHLEQNHCWDHPSYACYRCACTRETEAQRQEAKRQLLIRAAESVSPATFAEWFQ